MLLKPKLTYLGIFVFSLSFLFSDLGFAENTKQKALDPVVKLSIELRKPESDLIQGDIFINLYAEKSPISVKNFLDYARDGFYDGLLFHRLLDDFVIQGGGYDQNLNLKPTSSPIKNESLNKLSNTQWTLAMARSNKINSATSQFFINLANNSFLDHRGTSQGQYGYAVFGKVVDGQSFLNEIITTPVIRKGIHSHVPAYDIVITNITILQDLPSKTAMKPKKSPSSPSLKRKGVSSKKTSKILSQQSTPTSNIEIPVITPIISTKNKQSSNNIITANKVVTTNQLITSNKMITPSKPVTLNQVSTPNINTDITSKNTITSLNTVQKDDLSVSTSNTLIQSTQRNSTINIPLSSSNESVSPNSN